MNVPQGRPIPHGLHRIGIFLLLALAPACGPDSSPHPGKAVQAPPLPPTIEVMGESRMLTGSNASALLNPVEQILSVYSYDNTGNKVTYNESQDWTRIGNGISRTSNSRIPDYAVYRYQRSVGEKFSFSSEPRNPPLTIGYNIYIDYTSQQSDRLVTAKPLPRQTGSVLCLGDSIAAGAHTVESFYRNNDSQSWCGLLRSTLGPDVNVRNEGVPGGVLSGIIADLATFTAIPADTVILAFGMNDHVFEPEGGVATFSENLSKIVTAFASRGSNVLLVGFFQKNELWELEDRSKSLAYNSAISAVSQAQAVPFIDVYSAYEQIRANGEPQFYHLTADFIHHPNVYGQRVYYSLLIPYFISESMPASQIKGYVRGPWTQ